jgi:hypothetical protein
MQLLTDEERESSKELLRRNLQQIFEDRKRFESEGRTPEEIQCLMDPMETFLKGVEEDIIFYNTLREGIIPTITTDQLQQAVVWCRIASGLTQQGFAEKRGVTVEEVRRNERNEYHGVDEAIARTLIAHLGFEVQPITKYQLVKR